MPSNALAICNCPNTLRISTLRMKAADIIAAMKPLEAQLLAMKQAHNLVAQEILDISRAATVVRTMSYNQTSKPKRKLRLSQPEELVIQFQAMSLDQKKQMLLDLKELS